MISICLPTRGRPDFFKIMCMSVLKTAANPEDIEFVSYHDTDDTSVYEYVGNHKEVIGERIVQSQMYNECFKVATGPIYMFGVDDIVFYTKNWDKVVKNVFDKSVDKIVFVHPNDEDFGERLGVMGFLHKNWIDALGYFMPPYFAAWYADNWITDIANLINRKVFLSQIIVKHLNPTQDQTHKEYIAKEGDAWTIYSSKGWERERDASILQSILDKSLPKCCTEMEIDLLDLFFPVQMSEEQKKFVEGHGIYDLPLRELVKKVTYLGNGRVILHYKSKQIRLDGKCGFCD